MLKVVTTEEMQRIERAADAAGLSYDQMMANAGASIARAIMERWPDIEAAKVLILVGPGNNGGDGLVAGYHLMEAGAKVEVYLSNTRSAQEDRNFARLQEAGLMVVTAEQDADGKILSKAVQRADLIVDALLGTGIKLPLRGAPREILSTVKSVLNRDAAVPYIVAVDCPSGLDCDRGEIAEESLSADLTVTLAAAKPGLFEFPGAQAVGDLVIGSIGLPDGLPEIEDVRHILASPETVSSLLPERPLDAHKGTFGRVLIVAGSINYPGAAALAGLGAYRSGAGLVALAVPAVIQPFVAPILPEAVWTILPHESGVISKPAAAVLSGELGSSDALLIGPGFNREPITKEFLNEFLGGEGGERAREIGFVSARHAPNEIDLPPCVVDADGLKLLSELRGWPELLKRTAILTPHPGEFAIMTGLSVPEILSSRIEHARAFAEEWGHVIVLKGAFTIVAAPDGRLATIPIATPALATAGTGDVLAGVLVALRGQGLDAFEAAVLGAYIHARAGELAAEDWGTQVSVIAGDIVEQLPAVFSELGRD